jgi:hypothetical protein
MPQWIETIEGDWINLNAIARWQPIRIGKSHRADHWRAYDRRGELLGKTTEGPSQPTQYIPCPPGWVLIYFFPGDDPDEALHEKPILAWATTDRGLQAMTLDGSGEYDMEPVENGTENLPHSVIGLRDPGGRYWAVNIDGVTRSFVSDATFRLFAQDAVAQALKQGAEEPQTRDDVA